MSPISLNLIAIGVFTLTMMSLVAPLINLSPSFPAGITAVVLALGALDTLAWKNQGLNILLHIFSSPEQRQRIVYHEAGHFLVAYCLGIPVKDYTLNPWKAWRQGYSGRGGVVFDLEAIPPEQAKLDNFSTVWLAGIAAERLIYGKAEGGAEDKEKVLIALTTAQVLPSLRQQQINLAIIRAQAIIQTHQELYQTLVNAMTENLSAAECYNKLSLHQDLITSSDSSS